MKANALLLAGLLAAAAGCCCIGAGSGTWEDDPANYRRAWGEDKPADVDLVHSWYWRSPHFTREEAYFFQFRKHAQWPQAFVAANDMAPAVSGPAGLKPDLPPFEKPAWFLPKPLDAYDAWSGPRASAWLFVDKESGDTFICAYSL